MIMEPKSPYSINPYPSLTETVAILKQLNTGRSMPRTNLHTLMMLLVWNTIGCVIIGLLTGDAPSYINKSRTNSGDFNIGWSPHKTSTTTPTHLVRALGCVCLHENDPEARR